MADWTDQDVNSLLPGEPWTSAKALATFENPVALAQGAAGAPDIGTNWVPFNFETGGDGEIWSLAADGAVLEVVGEWAADGRFEYRLRLELFGTTALAPDLTIQVFLESTGWATAIGSTYAYRNSIPASATIEVGTANIDSHWHEVTERYYGPATTGNVSAAETKTIVRHATAQQITKVRIFFSGGSAINLGRVLLEKRMSYV